MTKFTTADLPPLRIGEFYKNISVPVVGFYDDGTPTLVTYDYDKGTWSSPDIVSWVSTADFYDEDFNKKD